MSLYGLELRMNVQESMKFSKIKGDFLRSGLNWFMNQSIKSSSNMQTLHEPAACIKIDETDLGGIKDNLQRFLFERVTKWK